MASKLYVRTGNDGANGAFELADLGFTVPTGASWTLLNAAGPSDPEGESGQFTSRELRDSKDLFDAITGGSLEWSKDGAIEEVAGDYLADFMIMQDFTDDFLDLSVGRFVLPNGAASPASGVEGETFWDNDDDTLRVWDGTQWLDVQTGSTDHGALSGLGDDDHTQYTLLAGDLVRNAYTGGADFTSASGLILPTATDRTGLAEVDGAIMWDSDDDTLYLHDGTQWLSIAATLSGLISHTDLTDIGTNTHDDIDTHIADSSIHFTEASIDHLNIQNIGTNSHDDIDTHIADSSIHFTEASIDHGSIAGLADDDHPQYTAWEQNETISGVWTFATDTNEPALVLTPDTSAPSTALADGAMAIINDLLYAYDSGRAKWLSVGREKFLGARKGNATNIHLRGPDGVATSQTGFRMARDGTITALFAQTEGSESWTFEVRRSGAAIASLVIAAAAGDDEVTTDVDVTAGDEIALFCNGTAVGAPVAGFEVAWRE